MPGPRTIRSGIRKVSVVRAFVLACFITLAFVSTPATASASPLLPIGGVWPLEPPARVTRGFEPPVLRWQAGHRGVDLAAPIGTPVHAAAAGTVRFAGTIAGRGVVVVDHGRVRTTYEPVVAEVAVDAAVVAGQVIGRIGHGSHCPTTCLHWGLRRGDDYLDPLQLLGSHTGSVRLVAADQRDAARRAAKPAPHQQWPSTLRRPGTRILDQQTGRVSYPRCTGPSLQDSACDFTRRFECGSCMTAQTSAPPAGHQFGRHTQDGSARHTSTQRTATGSSSITVSSAAGALSPDSTTRRAMS